MFTVNNLLLRVGPKRMHSTCASRHTSLSSRTTTLSGARSGNTLYSMRFDSWQKFLTCCLSFEYRDMSKCPCHVTCHMFILWYNFYSCYVMIDLFRSFF